MHTEVRRGQQGVGVCADGVESDVAQVEQASEPDHDVQAQRQHRVQQREVEYAHPCARQPRLERERQDRQGDARQRHADPGRVPVPL